MQAGDEMIGTGRGLRRIVTLAWAALAASPILIFSHTEYHDAGATPGWHHATLESGAVLYSWTRNRAAIWCALFVVGSVALRMSLRSDAGGRRLEHLASSRAGMLLPAFFACFVTMCATLMHSSEVLLLTMMLVVGFLVTWWRSSTGPALARATGRFLAIACTLLALAIGGECVFRLPAVVARTGGSSEDRVRLRDQWERSLPRPPVGSWRTRHLLEPKRPGVARILVLGDSFSYGDFIDDVGALWPSLLEDDLVAHARPAEVINTGTAGSDTTLERDILERCGWTLRPDLVLLQFTLNDAGADPAANAMPLLPVFGASLRRKSCFFSFLDGRFAMLQAAWSGNPGWSDLYREGQPGWATVKEAMSAIAASAREHGTPVVVVLFPMFDSDLADGAYRHLDAHRAVTMFASSLGIPTIDVRAALAAVDRNPKSWWVRPFDAHPNAAAHRLVAAEVARELARNGSLR